MPIYAYRCEACGHAKDVLQKFSDPLLSTCPSCGAEAFKKQVTAAGFQLKGSGWYVTDFRGDSKAAKPAAEGAEVAAGAAVNDDAGKGDAAKGDAGKADSGKSDGAKTDSGTGTSGKSDTGKSDSTGAKTTPAPAPAAAPATSSGTGGAGTAAGGQ